MKKQFCNSKGLKIKNHLLYQRFYELQDLLDFELIKVKGHQKNEYKNQIDIIFSLVDKAARKALRNGVFVE